MLRCCQAIRILITHAADSGEAGCQPKVLLHTRPRCRAGPHQQPWLLIHDGPTTSPPTWPSRPPASPTLSLRGPAAASSARLSGQRPVRDPQAPARPPH